MVQKTYHLTDDIDSRMRDMIMEIKGQDGYLDKSCLLIIFAQCWDTDVIAKRKSMVEVAFPKAIIAGITHYEDFDISVDKDEAWIFSFLFFDHSSFMVKRFSRTEASDARWGRDIANALKETFLKSVMLLASELTPDYDALLQAMGSIQWRVFP